MAEKHDELNAQLEDINNHPRRHGVSKHSKKSLSTDKSRLFKLAINYEMSHLDKDGKPKDNEDTFDKFLLGAVDFMHNIVFDSGADLQYASIQPNEFDAFMKDDKKVTKVDDDGKPMLDSDGKKLKEYKYKAGQSKSAHIHVMLKFRSQHRVSWILKKFQQKYDFLSEKEVIVDNDVAHAIAYPQHVDPSSIGKKVTFGDDKVWFYASLFNPNDTEKSSDHYNVLVGHEFLGFNFENVDSNQFYTELNRKYLWLTDDDYSGAMPAYYCNDFQHNLQNADAIPTEDYTNNDVYHFVIYGHSLQGYKIYQKLKRKGALLISTSQSPFKLSKVINDSNSYVSELAHELVNDNLPDDNVLRQLVRDHFAAFWNKHSDSIVDNTNMAEKETLTKDSFIFQILHDKKNQKTISDAMTDVLNNRVNRQKLGDANRTSIFYGGATGGTGKTQGARGIAYTHDGRPSFMTASHTKGTVDDFADGYQKSVTKSIIYDDANSSTSGPIDFIKAAADNHNNRSAGSRVQAKGLAHDLFIMTTTGTLFDFIVSSIKSGYKDGIEMTDPRLCDIAQQCIRRFGYNCVPHRVKPMPDGIHKSQFKVSFKVNRREIEPIQSNGAKKSDVKYTGNYDTFNGYATVTVDGYHDKMPYGYTTDLHRKLLDSIPEYYPGDDALVAVGAADDEHIDDTIISHSWEIVGTNEMSMQNDHNPFDRSFGIIDSLDFEFDKYIKLPIPRSEMYQYQSINDAVGPDGTCYATYTDVRKIDQDAIVALGLELKQYESAHATIPIEWVNRLRELAKGTHYKYVKCHDIRAQKNSLGDSLIKFGVTMNKLMGVDSHLAKYLPKVTSDDLNADARKIMSARMEAELDSDVF